MLLPCPISHLRLASGTRMVEKVVELRWKGKKSTGTEVWAGMDLASDCTTHTGGLSVLPTCRKR